MDAGSSGLRCLILDNRGNIASTAERPYIYHTPPELAPLGKEFQPEEMWQTLCQLIREAVEKAGVKNGELAGVGCASQREGLALLDREGRELYVGPNTDLRAFFEGMSLDADFGKEIYDITGHCPSFMFAPAKLRWFQVNRPETYGKIASVMSLSDWLAYRLCGERASEICAATEIGLLDFRRGERSARLLELLGLPPDIYPPLGRAGDRLGRVSARVASQTGIPEGAITVLAGADSQCGLLGMGVVQERQVGIMAGWSATLQMVTSQPIIDARGRTWSGCHLISQRWIVESNAGEAGGAHSWLRDMLFSGEERGVFAAMDSLAQGVPPGAEGVLAFIGPHPINMSQIGLKLGGFLLPVPPSSVNTGKAHLVRAALENLCFALRACLEQLQEVSGREPAGVSLGGGLSQSQFLAQMIADVLSRPVAVAPSPQVTGIGAALCAARGAGLFSCLEEAVSALAPKPVIVEPDPSTSAEYLDYYQRWLSTWQKLAELEQELL